MAFPKKVLWLPVLVLVVGSQILHSKPPELTTATTVSLIEARGHAVVDTIRQQRSYSNLCTNDELIQGLWVPLTLERPPYIPLSPRVRCMRQEDFYKPFSTYTWKPNGKCQLVDWNALQFTRLLSNQTIVFVGDSLSLEHYASLVHLLGDRARLPPKAVQHKRIKRNICHNATADNQHCVHVVFKTDFPLYNISQEIEASHPSVLVLNRGAHYVPDDELLADLNQYTLPALKQWNQQCQAKDCMLVWRTTVPGHPYCHNFTQPTTSVAEMQTYIEQTSTKDSSVYRKGEFHWQDFNRQNKLVIQLLQDRFQPLLPFVDIQIMDSYQTNILRPDNHRAHMNDCLHSCSPGGGSDLNSQWLLHMLVRRQQQQQKKQQEKPS